MRSDDVIAGRYRLVRAIGEGGGGVVWLGTDVRLHRPVALKLGARMQREGVGGAKLMHPKVIAVFDLVEDADGQEWLVMEYLPSRSLRDVRTEDGPLQPKDVARIGTQIASALAHLHQNNMVHRDVTPANVLVTSNHTAKLTDFGIATWESETQGQDPKTGGGTLGFQAPEVVRGNHATSASDIYSLGATLAGAMEGNPTPAVDPNTPFGALLAAMLHRDPEQRPTAEQVERRLAAVAEPTAKRRWSIGIGVAAVVVFGLVLAFVNPFRSGATATPPPRPRPNTAAGSVPYIGDPRTADPCGLTYANALSRYGEVATSDDYGNFNRCDALVYLTKDHQDDVDVKVELDTGPPDPSVPVERDGSIGIQRPPAQDGCYRRLLLPADYQVVISAQENGNESVDLCGMADAVTSSALVTLNGGPIPRRTLPPQSLAGKKACDLLDTGTVTDAFGPGPVQRTPGYVDWTCRWSYTEGPILVQVVFDRSTTGDTGGGAPVKLAGHPATVLARDFTDDGCTVTIPYRTYVDSTGTQTDERVRVDAEDSDRSPQQLCGPAQRLATMVAQRLFR